MWMDHRGYLVVLLNGREVRQHRIVAEQMLGRPLQRHEHVHHKNGRKDDNRPENLEVVDNRTHVRTHWAAGHYAPRVAKQTKPEAKCRHCDWFGRLRAKRLCAPCYQRDYYLRNPDKWQRRDQGRPR